ncbi:hypothetical protein [Haliea sp. E17]|uniref:hypothetical protein n=1 Tax=Haliea sp. E17 TaxID=3401576 RepID=UPI003AAFAF3E
MGDEFKLLKALATISATSSELAAVNQLITAEIGSADFLEEYDSLLFDILNTYRGLESILRPMVSVSSPEKFRQDFSSRFEWYANHYQAALSEARINAELTFEKYLQFRKRREVATGFPLLKHAFSRLHDFVDKWIDNDIWLAMTIDTLLKTLFRMLGELNTIQSRDPEDAFALYTSYMAGVLSYLDLIHQNLGQIEATRLPVKQTLSMTC